MDTERGVLKDAWRLTGFAKMVENLDSVEGKRLKFHFHV